MMPAKKSARGKGKNAEEQPLAEYRRKRDFSKTSEPSGTRASARPVAQRRTGALRFVIQKHAASHLHFDFRLELDGVMKSWAVPKGPSLDPGVKRLAMEVEDHPIAYNAFEGTIPAGEYGGGTVMVWDRGTYEATAGGGAAAVRRGYEGGKLDITMYGQRLHGAFTLVRTRRAGGSKPQWLLIKRTDPDAVPARDIVAEVTTSVDTGRTMEEIAGGNGRVWRSNRRAAAGGPGRAAPAATIRPSPATVRPVRRAGRAKPGPRTAGSAAVVRELEAMERGGGAGRLHVPGGATLSVSHLDKIFFPALGLTKGDLMRYYARVAPAILPVVADRPLVLRRFPNGVNGKAFYQQKASDDVPSGVRVETVVGAGGEPQRRFVGGDLATLLHTVQLGAISVDPWHSRLRSLGTPDYAVIDLDPGPRTPFARVVAVARWVKEELDALGLQAAVKTSGSSGLHIFVPFPPKTPEEAALLVAQIVATRVVQRHPREATIERAVKARGTGLVYVDYLQNIRAKTIAAAYSVRARESATVSTPLEWDELVDDLDPAVFTMQSMPDRIAERGDIWAAAMRKGNSLHHVISGTRLP